MSDAGAFIRHPESIQSTKANAVEVTIAEGELLATYPAYNPQASDDRSQYSTEEITRQSSRVSQVSFLFTLEREVDVPPLPLVSLNYVRPAVAAHKFNPVLFLTLMSANGACRCKFSMNGRDVGEASIIEQASPDTIDLSDADFNSITHNSVRTHSSTLRVNASIVKFTETQAVSTVENTGYSTVQEMLSNHPTILYWDAACGDSSISKTWQASAGQPPKLTVVDTRQVITFFESYRSYLLSGGHLRMIECLSATSKTKLLISTPKKGVSEYLGLPSRVRNENSFNNREVIALLLYITGQLTIEHWKMKLNEIKNSYVPDSDKGRRDGKLCQIYTYLFRLYELCYNRPVSSTESATVINSIKVALKNYDQTFWYNFLSKPFGSLDDSMTLAERIQTIAEYVKTFNIDPIYAIEGDFKHLYRDWQEWHIQRAGNNYLAYAFPNRGRSLQRDQSNTRNSSRSVSRDRNGGRSRGGDRDRNGGRSHSGDRNGGRSHSGDRYRGNDRGRNDDRNRGNDRGRDRNRDNNGTNRQRSSSKDSDLTGYTSDSNYSLGSQNSKGSFHSTGSKKSNGSRTSGGASRSATKLTKDRQRSRAGSRDSNNDAVEHMQKSDARHGRNRGRSYSSRM